MPRTAKAEEPSPPNDAASSSARGASPSLVESAGSEDEDSEPSDLDETSWISWFCSLKGNEFFCEVEEDFIQDDFNLTGLSSQVPYYEYALDTILDVESPASANFSDEQQEAIENAAELLYGLIHARFAITPRGMGAMLEKYKAVHFGRCPRVFCGGQPALPVGQGDLPRTHTEQLDWGSDPTDDEDLAEQLASTPCRIPLPRRGDAVIFDSRCFHCGGAHTGGPRRVLFYCSFQARDAWRHAWRGCGFEQPGTLLDALRGRYCLDRAGRLVAVARSAGMAWLAAAAVAWLHAAVRWLAAVAVNDRVSRSYEYGFLFS